MPCHHIREYRYAYGAVEPVTGEHFFLVLPRCDTICMNVFLEELSKTYHEDQILLVCDGASWHKSKGLKIPGNITLLHIPPYTPEMNPIEQIWKQLRAMGFNPQGLCKKNTDASEMDESKEAGSEFIEAGGDPTELLELEEEGFHEMTLLVKPPIDVPRIGIIFPGRDTEIRVVVGDELTELPLAIGPVGENGRSLEVDLADQFLGDSNVRGIASG